MPKFLRHFETVAGANDGAWVIDDRWTYIDTSLFQLVEGLRYMFPRRMATLETDLPGLVRIHDQVAELPRIKAYLASDRRHRLRKRRRCTARRLPAQSRSEEHTSE